MRKKRFLPVLRASILSLHLVVGWLALSSTQAQGRMDGRMQHILQLSKELTWPRQPSSQPFTIEIISADSTFVSEMRRECASRKAHGRPIAIVSHSAWGGTHASRLPNIVYVARAASRSIPAIYDFFRHKPVLVITETKYEGHGWMVYFYNGGGADRRRKENLIYTFNRINIKNYAHLSVSPRLLGESPEGRTRTPSESQRVAQASIPGRIPAIRNPLEAPIVVERLRDLQTCIAFRDRRIAQQERIIVNQRETISMQAHRIDSLALMNRLTMQMLSIPTFTPIEGILLPTAEVAERMRIAGLASMRKDSLTNQQPKMSRLVSTAPWDARAAGGILFLSLISFVSITVLFLAILQPVSVFGGGATSHSPGVELGASTLLPSAHERKTTDSELDRLMAYNRRLEMQMQIRVEEYEKLRTETVLRSAKRQAFLANMSHEFRTPLNAIVGLSQYLASAAVSDQELRDILNIVDQNAYCLMRMMNVLMTLTMLYNGDLTLELEDTTILRIFQSLAETMNERQQELGNLASIKIHYEIPRLAPTAISVDIQKFLQVLDLLITNTLVAHPEGVHTCGCQTSENPDLPPVFFVEVAAPVPHGGTTPQGSPLSPMHSAAADMANNLSLDLAYSLAELMGTAISSARSEDRITYRVPLPV